MTGRRQLFGCPIDLLTMDESVEKCAELVHERRFAQHVVVNAAKYVLMEDDPLLRKIVSNCEIVNADGMSTVWAGRFLGVAVPERVTGIDLMERLLALAESQGWGVYFLGARQEVLEAFLEAVRKRFPELRMTGSSNGYFADEHAAARSVRESGAQILFVGMPSPRKEHFVQGCRDELGPLLAVGVGGSFDVWAGKTRRAPAWMQRAGLEWLYRFAQEPRRMWRRYLIGNARFLGMTLAEKVRRG